MKARIIFIIMGILTWGYSSWAQHIDPYIDDAYYSKKDEAAIQKVAKEKAQLEYEKAMARMMAQRKADSIAYVKYMAKLHNQQIDAYNGHASNENNELAQQGSSQIQQSNEQNRQVYGPYSSRLKMFHSGSTVIINNPNSINIYPDGWDSNNWGYNSYYDYNSWDYPNYAYGYYPWYTRTYAGYYGPWGYDPSWSWYWGWNYGYTYPRYTGYWGYGYPYYPIYYGYYDPFYYDSYWGGYYPYYSPYYAGYYDGYYSGYNYKHYYRNVYSNGERSYMSYSNRGYNSPYQAVENVTNQQYRQYNNGNSLRRGRNGYTYVRRIGNSYNSNNNSYTTNNNNYNYERNNNSYTRSYTTESNNRSYNSQSSNRSYGGGGGGGGYHRNVRR